MQGGGCSGFAYDLFFDQPQEMDRTFEVKGVKLMCDQMSLMYLVGTEVDYVEVCTAPASSSSIRT